VTNRTTANPKTKTRFTTGRCACRVAGLFFVRVRGKEIPNVNTATKTSLTFAVSLLVGAFKAFVLMLMWNWFVSPVFHIESISFWQVLGLLWMVQLFVDSGSENPLEIFRWESLFLVLDACVPDHKNEELREELKQKNEGIWPQLGIQILGRVTSYAVTLGLGWVVHTFFVTA
jgi:hypothetical protein